MIKRVGVLVREKEEVCCIEQRLSSAIWFRAFASQPARLHDRRLLGRARPASGRLTGRKQGRDTCWCASSRWSREQSTVGNFGRFAVLNWAAKCRRQKQTTCNGSRYASGFVHRQARSSGKPEPAATWLSSQAFRCGFCIGRTVCAQTRRTAGVAATERVRFGRRANRKQKTVHYK